ncbi:hypothetical protein EDB80DRAFT_727861 [Ilyonectria destructans]|nr:hypothetical protein EDB80DRAFT_727861 [Ilyonectria destructans]
MRTQCHISAVAPIPITLPSHVALAFLQTYIPTMTQVPDFVSFYEIPADPSLISDDSFFGPWDESVRAYTVDEVINLTPGLTRVTTWPAVYQSAPDGIRVRASTAAGVISWTKWTVRRRQDGMSPEGSDSTSSSITYVAEEWELHADLTIEANRLLMPFVLWYAHKVITQLCQGVIDELVRIYFKMPV